MKKPFLKISNKIIGYDRPIFIIAEAGVNHNGKLGMALDLVDAAAQAGADAIKFQTFNAEDIVTKSGKMASYQRINIGKPESQQAMLKKLELKENFYAPILERCKKKKIIFLSTPHGGFHSVDFLNSLGVPAFKFGSGDITNFPVLGYAARFKKPMILGTGMAKLAEIRTAIKAIQKSGNKKIIVLHATTAYPCPPREVNLRAMQTMMQKLDVLVGYSDHTLGTQTSVMAATLGACVIEKHFTINKAMAGPDHKASLEPEELKMMVRSVRDVSVVLGSSQKKPTKSEGPMIKNIRKSLVALTAIKKGEIFTAKNLCIKRPGTGFEPRRYFDLLGKKAKQNIQADSLITEKDYA